MDEDEACYQYAVPNLDDMTGSQLAAFGKECTENPSAKAIELFPDKPFHFMQTFGCLLAYAAHKSEAMRLRLAGHLQAALTQESVCLYLYEALPSYARWSHA